MISATDSLLIKYSIGNTHIFTNYNNVFTNKISFRNEDFQPTKYFTNGIFVGNEKTFTNKISVENYKVFTNEISVGNERLLPLTFHWK